MHLLILVLAFLHVENIARIDQAIEVEDPEEVYQEKEFKVADPAEEQALEANFANSDPQQGKPQFI